MDTRYLDDDNILIDGLANGVSGKDWGYTDHINTCISTLVFYCDPPNSTYAVTKLPKTYGWTPSKSQSTTERLTSATTVEPLRLWIAANLRLIELSDNVGQPVRKPGVVFEPLHHPTYNLCTGLIRKHTTGASTKSNTGDNVLRASSQLSSHIFIYDARNTWPPNKALPLLPSSNLHVGDVAIVECMVLRRRDPTLPGFSTSSSVKKSAKSPRKANRGGRPKIATPVREDRWTASLALTGIFLLASIVPHDPDFAVD